MNYCAHFHILQDKVLSRDCVRWRSGPGLGFTMSAPVSMYHRRHMVSEEDMRNGVIGHSDLPVMMNHSSSVGKRKMFEQRVYEPEKSRQASLLVRTMNSCEM